MYFLRKIALLFIVYYSFIDILNSQRQESSLQTQAPVENNFIVSGAVTVTTKGISLFPNLSLGKPAAIFDLSVGKQRFAFEPQIRFGLDGKPWSFIFWFRYKMIKADKFTFNIGTHPSFVFGTRALTNSSGITQNYITTARYWATEFVPNYAINKNISMGLYYLYAKGLDPLSTKTSNFISFTSSFKNIHLLDDYYFRIAPQLFYLQLDSKHGYYFSETATLSKKNFPFSISSVYTKILQSTIVSQDNLYNVSLIYNF